MAFALRTRRAAAESPNGLVRFLLWMQAHGTLVIGLGLLLRDRQLQLFAALVPLTAVLLVVCARTTRGGWRWRWGDDD